MLRRPPISTRTVTLFPYPTLFRSGETEDDALRRVFSLPAASSPNQLQEAKHESGTSTTRRASGPRRSLATDRMSSYISANQLHVSFVSGPDRKSTRLNSSH